MGTSSENKTAKRNAELAGILAMSGGIGKSALDDFFIDQEHGSIKRTRDYDDFLKKLTKGDVVLQRSSAKGQFKRASGITTEDLLIPLKGSEFYHGGIYKGAGNQFESPDMDVTVKGSRLKDKYPKEMVAYRPKNAKLGAKAVELAAAAKGAPYESFGQQVLHWLSHNTGVDIPKMCGTKNGATTCTGLIAKAYPSLFDNEFIGPKDVMLNPDMNLVAHYGKLKPLTTGQQILKKGVYPAVKSLKYAAPLALAAYMMTQKDEEKDNAWNY